MIFKSIAKGCGCSYYDMTIVGTAFSTEAGLTMTHDPIEAIAFHEPRTLQDMNLNWVLIQDTSGEVASSQKVHYRAGRGCAEEIPPEWLQIVLEAACGQLRGRRCRVLTIIKRDLHVVNAMWMWHGA